MPFGFGFDLGASKTSSPFSCSVLGVGVIGAHCFSGIFWAATFCIHCQRFGLSPILPAHIPMVGAWMGALMLVVFNFCALCISDVSVTHLNRKRVYLYSSIGVCVCVCWIMWLCYFFWVLKLELLRCPNWDLRQLAKGTGLDWETSISVYALRFLWSLNLFPPRALQWFVRTRVSVEDFNRLFSA